MKITRTIVSLAAAATLALSACGGDDTSAEPDTEVAQDTASADAADTEEDAKEQPTTQEDDPAADGEQGAEDPNAGGGENGGAGAESPKNAASPAVDVFMETQEGAQRMPSEALASSDNMEALQGMDIEPAECKEATLKSNEMQNVEGAERDGAMVIDEATGQSKSVVVTKFPDAAGADEILQLAEEMADKCAEAKVGQGGQEMTLTQEFSDADVEGATKAATQTVTTDLGGMEQKTGATLAVKDSFLVAVNTSGQGDAVDTDETNKIATEMIAALN